MRAYFFSTYLFFAWLPSFFAKKVFTKPPWEPGARLIPEILVAPDGSCELPEMSTAEHDVTGTALHSPTSPRVLAQSPARPVF